MKKSITLLLASVACFGSFAQGPCPIAQQTITASNLICSGKGTVSLASSETGVYYYLRNNADNSIVDGPVEGTGSAINFTANSINVATTYNVNAVSASGALDFERDITSYVTTGTGMSSVFTGTNQITVEAWVNTESYSQQQTIVGNYGPGTNGMQFLLRIEDDKLGFWVNNGGFNLALGSTELPLNTWVHIAGTWDGTTAKVYYNGVLVGSTLVSGTFPATTNEVRIGANYPNESFDGKIDNLRIWNVAKTATEINNDKALCLTGAEPNLLALYNFDNITSTILEDLTANNYDGTFVGTPVVTTGTIVCSACSLQMSGTVTITPSLISQTAVTPLNTNVVCSGNAVIDLASSETGINYYLRNDANDAIVAGPVAGTGGPISINSGVVNTNSTFNVYGVKPSSALNFDGEDDYGVIAPSSNLNSQFTNNTITVEGWYYIPAKFYNDPMLIGESYLGDGTIKYTMYIDGSTLFGGFFNGGWHTANASVPFNQWVHIACTYDQSNIKLYFNGVLVSSVSESAPLPVSTEEWRIGRRWDGSYGNAMLFQGKMDEVRIWNIARTQPQIAAAMDSCLTGSENNLVAYYKFEDGNSTATDVAGGDQNATLLNFASSTAYMPGREICTTCSLEMTVKPTISVNPIGQQAVTPANTNVICSGSGTVTIAGSEANVNYYLRNDANDSIVSGPVTGSGSPLTLNTGTVSSTSTFNVYAVKPSTALNFDGNNDFVSIPNSTTLPAGNSNYTIEAWIKPDTYGNKGIVGWGNYGTVNEVNALRLEGNDQLINYWWNVDLVVTVPNLNNGQWHHVAVTYDGTTRRMIVDGLELGSDTPPAHNVTVTNNLTIGSTNNAEYFDGGIDEVRIWNVARSAAQLSASMNSCLSGTETGLVAYYNFENIAVTSLTDVTGGSTGTLMNMDLSTAQIIGTINCGCTAEMTSKPMVTVNPISNETVTAAQSSICNSGSTTIDLGTSEATVSYYLRNDLNDTIVAGPLAGTGSAISFNTGTISATTTYNVFAENAPANHALDFDGSDDYVSVPSGINIANQSFTIEFWAKRNNSNAYNFVIGQGTSNTNDGLHIGFRSNNDFTFAFYGDDLDVSTSAGTDGNYHHYSCVYNAGQSGINRFVYIDGNLAGSNSASNYTGSGELMIGALTFGGNNFNGSIDEVKIWNRALAPAEMQNGMNTCLSGNEAGLIAYYNMNAVSNSLVDLSGNGHNGALVNMDSATDFISGAPSVMCTRCELEMSQTATVTIKNSTSSNITLTECDSYIAPDLAVYTTSGIKTAVITNTAGCDSTITIDLTIVNSSSAVMNEIACGSYTWATNGTIYNAGGTYTAVIPNAVSCDSTVTLNLTINNADVTTTTNGLTITANANGAAYLWLDCDNQTTIAGEIGQSFTAIANGNYAAIVTENGCTDTSACVNISTVGLTEVASTNNLILFPNPTSGYVSITQTGTFNNTIVRLMTIDGKASIIEGNFTGNKWSFDMSDYASGIYFIEVSQKDKVTRMKVVKN